MIKLTYGAELDQQIIITFIRNSGRDCITQGRVALWIADHRKPVHLITGCGPVHMIPTPNTAAIEL